MRYKLPDACAGVTLAGLRIDAAADRTIEAAAEAAIDLAPHGIVPVEESDARAAKARDDRRMLR